MKSGPGTPSPERRVQIPTPMIEDILEKSMTAGSARWLKSASVAGSPSIIRISTPAQTRLFEMRIAYDKTTAMFPQIDEVIPAAA